MSGPDPIELLGTGVSPGIAVGRALVMEREAIAAFRLLLRPDQVEGEVQRLTRAAAASREQLLAIKERLSREVGLPHAYIFDAQLLMLEDPLLLDKSVAVVREEHVNAEWALSTVSDQLHALFDSFSDEYLKERSTDLDDVLGRVQLNLAGSPGAPSLSRLPGEVVLVAHDLTPSEAATLEWDRVLALAIDAGSRTYHTALLARSLGIPAVVGLKDATTRIPPGALVVVDGSHGHVVVEPSQPALVEFRETQERERVEERRLLATRALPCVTRDGVTLVLLANVEFPAEVETALEYGAQGIGLFRSEYLLGRSRAFPSEEQQIDVYRRLLEQMRPYPVTIRTWDVEPEDVLPGGPSSPNPALGERALRLLRRAPAPFRAQLRALMRAGCFGPLRIVFPFVTGPSDLREALALVGDVRDELRREGTPFAPELPIGLNLEVPSAAVTADLLAPHVSFFSVGTNDLIQYLLAVDRVDPRVAGLYEPLHPAVLRTLKHVAEVAVRFDVPLSVCGEMAAEPATALFLLGIGIRELSMSPSSIPRVKQTLRGCSAERAGELAARCLALASAGEVAELLQHELLAADRTAASARGERT